MRRARNRTARETFGALDRSRDCWQRAPRSAPGALRRRGEGLRGPIRGPRARPALPARPQFLWWPFDFGDSSRRRALGARTRGGRRRWVLARGPSFYGWEE